MTMLDEVLNLGGVVRQSSEMSMWQKHDADIGIRDEVLPMLDRSTTVQSSAEGSPLRGYRAFDGDLSTCHNSPQIEYRAGASLLKVKRQPKEEPEEDGEREGREEKEGNRQKRGAIAGFTAKSRNRLIRTVSAVRRDCLPVFVTLTFPANYPVIEKAKKHLDNLIKRLARKFPMVAGVWKLEPQKRGAPHFHLLVWGVEYADLVEFVPLAWYQVVQSDDPNHLAWHRGELGNEHCVQQIKTLGGISWYINKYMSKEVGAEFNWGRWWGVFFRDRLPLGELVNVEVTEKQAVQFIRYMRRFARIKSRDYKSLTIICNADTWVNRLL